MAAAHALITMTAQRRSVTAERWRRVPCDAAMQDVIGCVPKICRLLHGRCRPPQGRAGSSLLKPPGTLYRFGAGHLNSLQRTGNCLQMTPGQVQIDSCMGQLGMAE